MDPAVTGPDVGRRLDELAANVTAASRTRLIDGWWAKVAPERPFRRANAVLPPVGAGDDPRATAVALDAIEAWYRSLGRRVLVQVSEADPTAAALDAVLAARGYAIEAPVDVLVASTDDVVAAGAHAADGLAVELGDVAHAVTVRAGVDEPWTTAAAALHGDDAAARARTVAYGSMLAPLGTDALGAAATVAGAPVGVGLLAKERGWGGLFALATAPAWRQRGIGGALVGALAVEARHRAVTHLYLQVERDNAAAHSRYRSLGFTPHHRYHYRVEVQS